MARQFCLGSDDVGLLIRSYKIALLYELVNSEIIVGTVRHGEIIVGAVRLASLVKMEGLVFYD
jgi:hypothetical protein